MSQKSQQYLLVCIERKEGHLNNTIIEEITWLCLDTLKECSTTLDPTYRNYRYWRKVLISKNPEGIYTNLKLTGKVNKHDVPVISADSKPEKQVDLDVDTLIEVLEGLKMPQLFS
jgi:hypothetical protein